jgi:hypothetical protein
MTSTANDLQEGQSRTREWWIGLAGWVLQDGNYPDVVTGDRRRFALEFGYDHHKRLRLIPDAAPTGSFTGRGVDYDIVGSVYRELRHSGEDAMVLDFGLLAHTQNIVLDDLEPPKAGMWLAGEISLHVDHFAYMGHLAQLPGMPPMIYTWTIEEIQLDTTPFIEVEYGDRLYGLAPDEGTTSVPDPSRESWRTIDQTRTWQDDGSYRLRCTLADTPPQYAVG